MTLFLGETGMYCWMNKSSLLISHVGSWRLCWEYNTPVCVDLDFEHLDNFSDGRLYQWQFEIVLNKMNCCFFDVWGSVVMWWMQEGCSSNSIFSCMYASNASSNACTSFPQKRGTVKESEKVNYMFDIDTFGNTHLVKLKKKLLDNKWPYPKVQSVQSLTNYKNFRVFGQNYISQEFPYYLWLNLV